MKKTIILLLLLFSSTATFAFQTPSIHKIDHYKQLVGKWEGSGFITDKNNKRQDVRATQWVSIQDQNVIVNGIFDNNQTGFKADFLKQFYYDVTKKGWRIKVYVENKYFSTAKLSLSDNYTLIYTFKDAQGVMNRTTVYAAFPFGWTEMLEMWTGQTWDIKRRVIMRKLDTATTALPKSAVIVPTKKKVVQKKPY